MSLRIVFFASGRGSNVKAILDAIAVKKLDAKAVCVICNDPDADVLPMAETYGVSVHCVPSAGMERVAHEQAILEVLSAYTFDVIALCGYMRLLTPHFIHAINQGKGERFRILNIHPALLPAFPGPHSYEDAYHHGVKLSGITIHYVDEKMDNGPILLQASFERKETDTLLEFKARGLALEHQMYWQALQLLAEKRVRFTEDPVSGRVITEIGHHVRC